MSSQQLNVQDDWPSAKFREELVARLEPELVRIRENPENRYLRSAQHFEELAFAESTSKTHYMQILYEHIKPYHSFDRSRPSTPHKVAVRRIRLMDLQTETTFRSQSRQIENCRYKFLDAQIELEVQITRTKNEIRTLKAGLESIKAQNQDSSDSEEERISTCLQKARESLSHLRLMVEGVKKNYVDLETRNRDLERLEVELTNQRYEEDGDPYEDEYEGEREPEEYDGDRYPNEEVEWPSRTYRQCVAARLKTEIKKDLRTSKNLPIPGLPHQLEKYVFSLFGSSKSKYMRTIVTMIDALQDYSPMRSIPYKNLINDQTEEYLRTEIQKVSDGQLKLQESQDDLTVSLTTVTDLIKKFELSVEGIQAKHAEFFPNTYYLTADECNISKTLKDAYQQREMLKWPLEPLPKLKVALEEEKATLLEYLERVAIQVARKKKNNKNVEVEDDEEDEEDNKRKKEEYYKEKESFYKLLGINDFESSKTKEA